MRLPSPRPSRFQPADLTKRYEGSLRRGETAIKIVTQTDIPGAELVRRGKVRDVYAIGDRLVIVATDRISAFDVVLPDPIPRKGAILTALSIFWFEFFKDVTPNHLITADLDLFPAPFRNCREQLEGRSMLVNRADMFPVECVARGYLAGSAWKEYRQTGAVCGIRLPHGLKEADKLSEPIFTPAAKATSGHDENITELQMADRIGEEATRRLKEKTLELYLRAAQYAEERGIIIADTKFEFGARPGEIILADEVLTPDSSRFWPRDSYSPGRPQQSFDKQFVRDYLETLDWDKRSPGPRLPETVIERTSEKYIEAYGMLTGIEGAVNEGYGLRTANSGRSVGPT